MDQFLKSKSLTKDEFLNACVLSGCDYLNKLSNIEIEKCIEYVKKFHTLENTLNELKKTRSMYNLEEYNHIKNMYQFKTSCTEKIVNQHKDHQGYITQKLNDFKSFKAVDFKNLYSHLELNGIPLGTIPTLIRYFKDSRNEFLIIRKNFFSKFTH